MHLAVNFRAADGGDGIEGHAFMPEVCGEAILRNVADAVTSLWNLSPVDFPDAFSSSRKWRRNLASPCPCTAMILFFQLKEDIGGREKIVHVNIGASTTFGKTFDKVEDSVMDSLGACSHCAREPIRVSGL